MDGFTTKHKIVIGDSRIMDEVRDKQAHLIITSPPYWQLKDYGAANQIGFDDSYEEYINNLNLVWKECYRVLDDGCRMCVNIGDQFARSVYYGRYKVIPIRTEIIKFCESIGFDYMGAIIWQKVTNTNTTGGASVMGSYPYPRNGIISIDYEFILLFKKIGKSRKVAKIIKERSQLTKEEWTKYFQGHWNFSGERQKGHIAMFPLELPRRLIKMFSFVGDTVLDPFLGSGTTSLSARLLNRNSIGYEINSKFLPVIKDKLDSESKDLFDSYELKIVQKDSPIPGIRNNLNDLPYKFKDLVQIDKKIDPKKMNYGSKINSESKQRDDYTKVTSILNPLLLKLDSGIIIRLIGLKEKEEKKEEAIDYLYNTIQGKKVFLRFDEQKYDDDNNLLCYLYLKNKTFINAHLIKNGYVTIDKSWDFKMKDRFIKFERENN